jgi:hypothetical protein
MNSRTLLEEMHFWTICYKIYGLLLRILNSVYSFCYTQRQFESNFKQTILHCLPPWCVHSAERRAQLTRSRSRQNVLSPDCSGSSGAVIREINFDPESSVESTPAAYSSKRTPKTSNGNNNKKKNGSSSKGKRNGDISSRSEAEELLERLRAL